MLQTPEAGKGRGAKEHVWQEARAVREISKHKTREVQEYVIHVRHEST